MRDHSTASTAEQQALGKQCDEMRAACDELARNNEKLTVANDKYEEEIIDLKEMVRPSMCSLICINVLRSL